MPNSHRPPDTTNSPIYVVSGVAVWIEQLLLTCSDFQFSVGDSLELPGIQFKQSKQTRHGQNSFVGSGAAMWIINQSINRVTSAMNLDSGSVQLICCEQTKVGKFLPLGWKKPVFIMLLTIRSKIVFDGKTIYLLVSKKHGQNYFCS